MHLALYSKSGSWMWILQGSLLVFSLCCCWACFWLLSSCNNYTVHTTVQCDRITLWRMLLSLFYQYLLNRNILLGSGWWLHEYHLVSCLHPWDTVSDIQFLECQITKWGKEKFLLVTTAYKKKKKGWQIALHLLKCKINLCATLFFFFQCRFEVVGYGCSTCVGNTAPLPEAIRNAIKQVEL